HYDNEVLEVVIFNFLQSGNFRAATSMIHMIFDSDRKFKLSNELWAAYIQQMCRSGNHHGAVLIYHHFIDHYSSYSHENISAYNNESIEFPFLLTPSILEQLAAIFQHSKDHARIRGLLKYFKRFYSYISHRKTYKSLKISLVEAYSISDDLPNALLAFKDLSYSLRGHFNHKNWAKLNQLQKMSVFTNHVWRRNNIKTNSNRYSDEIPVDIKSSLDLQQDSTARKLGVELFNPIIDRNIYTSPNSTAMPILNGSLYTSDLPYFEKIINESLDNITSKDHGILTIIPTILSTHFILHIFIIKGLSKNYRFKEALLILQKMPQIFPYINSRTLLREENYINILHYIRE
ncbi:uncharacterized protein CANTADRAFT_38869, partial [Suhomyces tanzawaensis NRRL Y-17324]